MMKTIYLLLVLALFTSCKSAKTESSGNDLVTFCHYMTWFKHAKVDGIEKYNHWEWTSKGATHNPRKSIYGNLRDISSVYYPRIGVYDSGDPDVINYHIMTAKMAGIEGFITDWYGPGGSVDENLAALFNVAESVNFKVAVCFEEKNCFPTFAKVKNRDEAVAKAIKDLSYLCNKYGRRANYWKRNGKPVILVFNGYGNWGNFGKKVFKNAEWQRIIKALPCQVNLVYMNSNKATVFDGYFLWCGNQRYRDWFYKLAKEKLQKCEVKFAMGSALPGFDDRGVWGWGNGPRFEPRLGLETYKAYWDDFEKSGLSIIQLITWNDFEEGTVIEPTVQFGNLYIDYTRKRVHAIKKKQHDKANLSLPYYWFYLKKFAPSSMAKKVASIKNDILNDNYKLANKQLEDIVSELKIAIPEYISINEEYPVMEVLTESGKAIKAISARLMSPENIINRAKLSVSSQESPQMSAENLVDYQLDSRWASKHDDNQWVLMTFDNPVKATELAIIWETAFAKTYDIQISTDGLSWKTIAEISKGKQGLELIKLPKTEPFSQLKIVCKQRATDWGFSIYEIGLLTGDKNKTPFEIPLTNKLWNKDKVVKWRLNGFELVSQTYGSIESQNRYPFNAKGILIVDVSKLKKINFINYTIQVHQFDKDGNYLGFYDIIKRQKQVGKKVIHFKDIKDKIHNETQTIKFKIWLEGKKGGLIEIPTFIYIN